MAAATLDRQTTSLLIWREIQALLKAAAVIPAGVLVSTDATGFAINATNVAGQRVIGRSAHRGDTTATPADVEIVVEAGVFAWGASAALIALGQAAVGLKVYVVDNQTVGLLSDATAGVLVGRLEQITDGKFYVSTGLSTDGDETATLADAVVAVAKFAQPEVLFSVDIADAATASYDFVTSRKLEIVDVEVIKNAAGAGNTVQIQTGGAVAISDAIAAAVDKTVTRAGTIDRANNVIAAGGTIRMAVTRAAGSGAMKVILRCIPRA